MAGVRSVGREASCKENNPMAARPDPNLPHSATWRLRCGSPCMVWVRSGNVRHYTHRRCISLSRTTGQALIPPSFLTCACGLGYSRAPRLLPRVPAQTGAAHVAAPLACLDDAVGLVRQRRPPGPVARNWITLSHMCKWPGPQGGPSSLKGYAMVCLEYQ